MSINLSLRHLRAFVAIADCGGYSAAARVLNVAQSALSRTIVEIEQELGTCVLERTTRRVTLTAAGEQLLQNARRVLQEFDAAMSRFQLYKTGHVGIVSLAALSSFASILLPEIISQFRKDKEGVRLILKDGFAEEVVNYVLSGKVEFGVTSLTRKHETLVWESIVADKLVCICSKKHSFAKKSFIAWEKLNGENFVSFDPSSSVRAWVDRALQRMNITLGAVTEARDVSTVAGLVSADLGVSVVPSLVLPMMQFCKIATLDLVEPVVEREICLVYDPLTPISPASRALMDLLRSGKSSRLATPYGVRWIEHTL